jgi:N utilization substance protein B
MKRTRRLVRRLAFQTLYEVDSVGHQPEEVIARHLRAQKTLDDRSAAFLRRLVLGTWAATPKLDELIAECAPEWPVEQLALVDRNILRLAIWEFAGSNETPLKVAINEAVELAKRYGSDSAPRFINGVLGTLADREAEIRRLLETEA